MSVGDTVLWIDQSGFRHTVTRCDPQQCEGHDGGTGSEGTFDAFVEPGGTSRTRSPVPAHISITAGFTRYAGMHGTITVAAEGTSTTSTTTTTTTSTTTSTPTADERSTDHGDSPRDSCAIRDSDAEPRPPSSSVGAMEPTDASGRRSPAPAATFDLCLSACQSSASVRARVRGTPDPSIQGRETANRRPRCRS